MPSFVFFRQQRGDGGIRTGIDWERDTYWHSFEDGTDQSDPVLDWWIDIRGEGPGVPDDPDVMPVWLRQHSGAFVDEVVKFAEELRHGVDAGGWPLIRTAPAKIPDVRWKIAVSALHRDEGRAMSSILDDIAENWEEFIARLEKPEVVRWP